MKKNIIAVCSVLIFLFSCLHNRMAEIEAVRAESQKYVDTGEYQKALDSYSKLYARFPDDPALENNYIDTVEGISKHSDKAFGKGEYAAADRTYDVLLNNYNNFTRFQKKLSFSKAYLNERIRISQIRLAETASRQYLSSGYYQKAVDACREVYKKYRKDVQSQKCLSATVEEIWGQGNAAYKKGDYASAGKIYRLLLKNTATLKTVETSTMPEIQTVNSRLKDCSAGLTRKGFELYREGNLQGAIIVWTEVLEFDPDNSEVRKAVDTASAQLKNIQ